MFLETDMRPGPYVCLEIHDNGCGMTETTKQHIFDPFFSTKETGRGLGLSAVLGIVQGHQGAIKVYSEPGKGTAFKLIFPVTNAAALPERITNREEDLSGHGSILLVEDEKLVQDATRAVLEKYGYTVTVAENGKEALGRIIHAETRFDLILLDLIMPVMGGAEFLTALRSRSDETPVILSSGFNKEESIKHVRGRDFSDFIEKPYTASKLARVVKKALTFHRQQKPKTGKARG